MNEAYKKLHDLVHETYLVPDKGYLKLLCAAIIANRLDMDPFWLFIVGGSSAGKSEFLNMMSDLTDAYFVSAVTSKTFISGMKKSGQETSLLMRIKNGTLLLKDFTSILSMHQEERKEVMGQFREIYDGKMVKHFGTGQTVHWEGHIGLIAAVTTAIHVARELYASMGERFVMYAPEMPERLAVARKAIENTASIREIRLQLRVLMKEYLDETIGVPHHLYPIPDYFKEEMLELADFSTRARSTVERDWRSSAKEITFVHAIEMPMRFSSQLYTLAHAFCIMNEDHVLAELDKNIIYKIALDSITATKRKALQELTRYEKATTAGLAVRLNYPTATVRRWLEDLNALEMVDRIKSSRADEWRILEKYRKIVNRFEGIQPTTLTLTEQNAVAPLDEVYLHRSQEIDPEEIFADKTTPAQSPDDDPDAPLPTSDSDW